MRDYAQNYRSKPRTHVVPGRVRGRMVAQPLRALFWKMAGGMVVATMCTGVVISLWIGQQIQNSLSSIVTLQQSTLQQESVKVVLIKERDALLSTSHLVARAAVQNGLYQTALNQQKNMKD